jgi:hypothetical protein
MQVHARCPGCAMEFSCGVCSGRGFTEVHREQAYRVSPGVFPLRGFGGIRMSANAGMFGISRYLYLRGDRKRTLADHDLCQVI